MIVIDPVVDGADEILEHGLHAIKERSPLACLSVDIKQPDRPFRRPPHGIRSPAASEH